MTEIDTQTDPIPETAVPTLEETNAELSRLIGNYFDKGRTPTGLPDTIKIGFSVSLVSVKAFGIRMGMQPKSAHSLLTALSIPLLYIKDKAYFNEFSLELVLHLITKPGGQGFATPTSKYVSSGKAARDKHIRQPFSAVPKDLIKESASPEAIEEMLSMRTLKASALSGTVRRLSPETKAHLKELALSTAKEFSLG
jgi:hypothetical protein